MRISLNWLKKLVPGAGKVADEELVRLIGARLVEVEGVIDERHKYDGIYVARVAKAEKIPETHLTLCQIDVGGGELARRNGAGEDGLVQVVCGAPNVREGMLAAWIAPGAVVPASVHGDAPFVIGRRKMLKKYESCGMLAGADELDFDDKHEKIAEIEPGAAKAGDKLAEVFGLDDQILEIENKSLTHRPDCFGMVGFAREVAGILGERLSEKVLRPASREKLVKKVVDDDVALEVKISDPKICERYTAVVMEKHGELRDRYLTEEQILIAKAGMRMVDPIVDATNFLMLLTGQPLHAFDYDKFVAVGGTKVAKIGVRLAKEGEKLRLLDGKEVELKPFDIVITSGKEPVALAGAMGGESTEIDGKTRRIIIESATFSLYNLRKTQMAHGIFSEAITRFTKGQPAYQTLAVAGACAEMLGRGFRAVAVADEWAGLVQNQEGDVEKNAGSVQSGVVKITTDEVNSLLGTDYSARKITRTLENVGMEVTANAGSAEMDVLVPEWRTDLVISEDIAEEVGRLLGYDNIAPEVPLHRTAERNGMFELKRNVRIVMRGLGANEVLTYSFGSGRLLEKVGMETENSYRIVNSISPELQYVRQAIVPSLLEKAYVNQKLPVERLAIFEMNQVYQKEWGMDADGVPEGRMRMGLVLAERKGTGTAYYRGRKFVERLLAEVGVEAEFREIEDGAKTEGGAEPKDSGGGAKDGVRSEAGGSIMEDGLRTSTDYEKEWGATARPFEPKRTAKIVAVGSGEILGIVGEFRNAVRSEFKLAEYLAGFEIDLEVLLENRKDRKEIYLGEIEKRDLTVSTEKSYGEILAKIREILAKFKIEADISPIGIYQPEGAKKRNISVHLEFHGKSNAKLMKELEGIG